MASRGRAWFVNRALVAFSLGLLCSVPFARNPQAAPDGDDEWNRAIEAARADRAAADPKGIYFHAFVKRLAQVQGPAVRACGVLHPASASTSFQAVAHLSKEGAVQQLLMRPTSGFHRCVRDKIKAATLPEPPKASYWIFWGNFAVPAGSK